MVDDEPHIIKALSRELKNWSQTNQIEILTCTSPTEALEIIGRDMDIFLVISDMMMPQINGAQLSEKAKSINPSISIFIMTGYAQLELVINAINTGIQALIIKPWNLEYLIKNLDAAVENHTIRVNEALYKKRIEEELKWGGELQKQLLIRPLPESEKIKFSVNYEPLPSLHCGGDYYDIIALDDDKFFLLCADVAGHGIKAAFITTILKSIIFSRYISNRRSGFLPSDFLSWLNSALLKELVNCPGIIITASVAIFDLKKCEMTFSNGGHTPLFVFREKKMHILSSHGTALNFTEIAEFKDQRIKLEKGDRIYSITDGLIEIGDNYNPLENDEISGILLKSSFEKENSQALCQRFRDKAFMGKFKDDITAIITEI